MRWHYNLQCTNIYTLNEISHCLREITKMTSKAWLSFGKIKKEWIYIRVNGITLGKMTWNWIIFMSIPRITDIIVYQALFVKHCRGSTWNGLFSHLIHICLQQSLTIWHGLDSTSWTWSTSRNPENCTKQQLPWTVVKLLYTWRGSKN